MASVLEGLQLCYKTQSYERSQRQRRTVLVYQGSQEECMRAQAERFEINSSSSEYGTLESTRVYQDEGPFWRIEVIYTVDSLDGVSWDSGTEQGPGHSELTVRTMSNPIENHPDYRKKWNYNLYYLGRYPPAEDYIYAWNNATAEDEMISTQATYTGEMNFNPGITYYCWSKTKSDCGSAPNGYSWVKLKGMTKPGIETYDYPVYEMTQYGKHKNKSDAGWAISSKIGKTCKPAKGDFGIDGKLKGNWLCEGGQVRHNGKYWVSAMTYVFSGNGRNWDKDIYPDA